MSSKESQKAYFQANREKIMAQRRRHRLENPEQWRQKARERSNKAYKGNTRKRLIQNAMDRYRSNKAFVEAAVLQHGCQNPGCQWVGVFHPGQLCFHHLDPSEKEKEVSSMYTCSLKKIVEEINKCVVVCHNCHVLAHLGQAAFSEGDLCRVSLPE